jgi:colicin import membrane protein
LQKQKQQKQKQRQAAKAEAEAAAEEEYKAIAAEVKADAAAKVDHTFKRQGEEIFRRDMGEPEFWLEKEDRFPRPILSADEQESLTRQVEIPQDQTPAYNPQNVLSPEFEGVSNYERGVGDFLEESKQNLSKLKNNPESKAKEIQDAEDKIIYLESLHENFFIGMNVFRTAKGGRDKIKA